MHLSYDLKELADISLCELERDLVIGIAGGNQLLIVLILVNELMGHVTPHNVHEARSISQMLLHLQVQSLQALLDLFGRKLFYNFPQIVCRQVQLI